MTGSRTRAAILFPVFAQAREAARGAQCKSNLKQMGAALAMYREDYDLTNPRYRFCPDAKGNELCMNASPAPLAWSGPNEIWWAPFDNSQAPDSPGPYPHYNPGFLDLYGYLCLAAGRLDGILMMAERPWDTAAALVILIVGLFQDYAIGVARRLACPYADLTLERR